MFVYGLLTLAELCHSSNKMGKIPLCQPDLPWGYIKSSQSTYETSEKFSINAKKGYSLLLVFIISSRIEEEKCIWKVQLSISQAFFMPITGFSLLKVWISQELIKSMQMFCVGDSSSFEGNCQAMFMFVLLVSMNKINT